jgi:hypothetical protein
MNESFGIPTIFRLHKLTKICAVTLVLISLSVSTMFGPAPPEDRSGGGGGGGGRTALQVPGTNTAEILAAALEKIKRLEARQDELSKRMDNLQHRCDELVTKH